MLLDSGKVLFAGGFANDKYLASAELYNPATDTFEQTGSMRIGAAHQAAVRLPDARVLVAGGVGSETASGFSSAVQVYDPQSERFEEVGSLLEEACCNTAVVLKSGKVLIAGGDYGKGRLASAQLYNPKTGQFEKTGSLSRPNSGYAVTLLRDGRVMIAGGWDGEPLDIVEIYDPEKGTFKTIDKLDEARSGHTATLLENGEVLLIGGQSRRGVLNMALVYKLPKT